MQNLLFLQRWHRIFLVINIITCFKICYKSTNDINLLIINEFHSMWFIWCERMKNNVLLLDDCQKTRKFSEQDVFSSNITRENKSALENLVRMIWIPRCIFSAVFSRFLHVAATCRIFQHRPRRHGRQICRELFVGYIIISVRVSASPMYVYLLNLYTVSFVRRNIGARSLPTFALGSPPIPRLLDWPE